MWEEQKAFPRQPLCLFLSAKQEKGTKLLSDCLEFVEIFVGGQPTKETPNQYLKKCKENSMEKKPVPVLNYD